MNLTGKNAIKIFVGLLCLVIVFHISIITKIIPYSIAWGGRLKSNPEMYLFEAVSILLNLFLGWVLLMKGGFVKYRFNNRITTAILWFFLGVFVLNTIGNLFAKTSFEKQFAWLTGMFAVLLFIILRDKKKRSS